MYLNKEESKQADAILDLLLANHLNMGGEAFNNEFKMLFDPHLHLTKLLKFLNREKNIDALFAELDSNYWGLKTISITEQGEYFRKEKGGYSEQFKRRSRENNWLYKNDYQNIKWLISTAISIVAIIFSSLSLTLHR